MNKKLFHRDFTLVVIGQIISLFGNTILRFALPLYLLDATGSSAIFGTVMAVSMIPMILLSPVGGIIADRVNRRNIMVTLDFITAGLVIVFGLALGEGNVILLIGGMLICFSAIQAMYQPAVQASIPVLSSTENLTTSNAVVNLVNALSGLLGPVLGGMLYGTWGLTPVVIVSAASFFASAVMEIFIHIPFTRPEKSGNFFTMIKGDMKESLRFLVRENPVMLKIMLIVCFFNLALSSMLTVGAPIIIKTILQLPNSNQLYGISEGFIAGGGLLGGILTGVFAKKLAMSRAHWLLFFASLSMLPAGAVLLFGLSDWISYAAVTLCACLLSMFGTMFTVQALAMLQRETPDHLIGKVISYALALCMCAQPLGQALYGFLFDKLPSGTALIILSAVLLSVIITLLSRKTFQKLKD